MLGVANVSVGHVRGVAEVGVVGVVGRYAVSTPPSFITNEVISQSLLRHIVSKILTSITAIARPPRAARLPVVPHSLTFFATFLASVLP